MAAPYYMQDTLVPTQKDLLAKMSGYLSSRIGEGVESPFMGMGIGTFQDLLKERTPEEMYNWWKEYEMPAERQLMEEQILPGIREAYIGTGSFRGTPRMGAESKAWQTWGNQSLANLGQMISGEKTRAANVLGMLPGMQQAWMGTQPEYSPAIQQAMSLISEPMQQIIVPPSNQSTVYRGGEGAANAAAGIQFAELLSQIFRLI